MEEITQKYQNSKVHTTLGHGYFIFLVVIILGIFSDFLLNMKIFSNEIYRYVGVFLLIGSSIVIYWAQKISANFKQRSEKNETSLFEQGPYKYIRHPTYLGLFIMTLGLGLTTNSFSSVVFAVIAYLIIKIFFFKKEEKLLEKKYGEEYIEYKKKVKNWI